MVPDQDRLTLPAFGAGGDWIVKLPDRRFGDVPRNEYAMMSMAADAGISVPEHKLVHRDEIVGLPDRVWPGEEQWAYAVRRFDRAKGRRKINIEDLAQVRNVYPDRKYSGNYETVASLIYRRRDVAALQEFARRLAFNVLIGNGDAHLKNWSLIYRDPKIPTLAPAYDLVSTSPYRMNGQAEELGLRFGGYRQFGRIRLSMFDALQRRLGAPQAQLPECAREVVERARRAWPQYAELLAHNQTLRCKITELIEGHAATLLSA